jgi:hypothetical protein
MNFKFVIVLLAFVAASQAMYFVVNTWADEYCNTTLIGKYWTNYEGYCIKKRFVSQDTGDCRTSPVLGDGVHYSYDSSYCTSDAEPEVPGDWHVVKLGEHCNYQANDSFYGVVAAENEKNTLVAVYFGEGPSVANTTLFCADTGVLSVSTCFSSCLQYSLANGACVGDAASNSTFASQTTCVAVPVAPVTEPTAAPVAGPTTSTPVRAPIKAPSTKTSVAGSIIIGSVAVVAVSIVALI